MTDTERGVAGLVLAGGSSSRLGHPKQLLTLDGVPLVRRAALNALQSECDRVFVVVGANHGIVVDTIADLDVDIVQNDGWREGMGSSVRAGVAHIGGCAPIYCAVLVMLVDQIQVGVQHLDQLIKAFRRYQEIACSEYDNTLGVPALFPHRYYGELQRLEGNAGARLLIKKNAQRAVRIFFPEAATDIDDTADLSKLPTSG